MSFQVGDPYRKASSTGPLKHGAAIAKRFIPQFKTADKLEARVYKRMQKKVAKRDAAALKAAAKEAKNKTEQAPGGVPMTTSSAADNTLHNAN